MLHLLSETDRQRAESDLNRDIVNPIPYPKASARQERRRLAWLRFSFPDSNRPLRQSGVCQPKSIVRSNKDAHLRNSAAMMPLDVARVIQVES